MEQSGVEALQHVRTWVRCRFRNEDTDVSLERRVDHFVVPETETTTHYFYALSRNFKIDDAATSREQFEGNERVLAEDVAIIEAQQRYITAYPAYADVAIRQDRVLIQAHKILDRLAAAEQRSNAAPAQLQALA